MKLKDPADVAVIVGRFQTDILHDGYRNLIDSVIKEHQKVIIFLGLSSIKCSINNPLDYESRRKMINSEYPDINVLYIKDINCNHLWSKSLDNQIENMTGPNNTICLYGGRDSFINSYTGKYNTSELKQEVFISSSIIRKKLALQSKGTKDFNSGVIWATRNRFSASIPTVDMAIFNDDYSSILLGKRNHEDAYRFIGGFVAAGETYEQAARRETNEETGLEVSDPQYIKSVVIDDWRYRNEQDKITTTFFKCKKIYGKPEPRDDIDELKWFPFNGDLMNKVVECHKVLVEILLRDK